MLMKRSAARIAVAASIAWTGAVVAQDTGGQTADAPGTVAADLAAGEEYYAAVCSNCHGPAAKGMASFPKLTGHDAEFLITRLEQYRAGETVGPNTALMAPIAADLSDEDIANLAAYIATELN